MSGHDLLPSGLRLYSCPALFESQTAGFISFFLGELYMTLSQIVFQSFTSIASLSLFYSFQNLLRASLSGKIVVQNGFAIMCMMGKAQDFEHPHLR